MTLARVTTWADGQILTAAALNAEFDNILQNPIALVGGVAQGVSRVTGLQGSVISNVGSFAAQGYQMRSTLMTYSVVATSSFSINTQTVGPVANGRDQAAAFASTAVHFYAISTGVNSTAPQGIVSTNPPPTGPVMPTNYSAWTYLMSAPYTVASSVTLVGNEGTVYGAYYNLSTMTVLNGGNAATATVETDVPVVGVPNIATQYRISIGTIGGITPAAGGNLVVTHFIYPNTAQPALQWQTQVPSTWAAGTINMGAILADLPNVRTTPTFSYKHTIATGTSAHMTLQLVGYKVPNGDVG